MGSRIQKVLKALGLAPTSEAEWSRRLGGRLDLGAGTRLDHATLWVREPAGCRVAIGEASNIECRIVLERPDTTVRIGARTHIGGNTLLDAACGIEIGDDVLIAFDVLVMDHDSHALRFADRRDDVADWMAGKKDWTHVARAPVRIRDKVWIGARVCILKGVEIGEGAVVGTGSVVTKDVAPWTVVAGNPAAVVRELTDGERAS